MQLDRPLCVGVCGVKNSARVHDAGVQLFQDFPPQRVAMALPIVHFAAWEFPYPARCVPASRRAMRNRPFSSMTAATTTTRSATRSFSGLCGYAEQSGAMGQIRHLGFLAVQSVAPKSISA